MEGVSLSEKRWLTLILVLFVVLGSIYAVVTPVFEASDELWHYPMIEHLAEGNPLPVQVFDPAQAGLWNQEASQPPLYYYLGAVLTFWIDTADLETIRWVNPHADGGVITADGNTSLVVHDPAANPWRGTLLAVRVVRLFSVLLGAATVYLTYRIGHEVAPGRPEIALGAAAVNAFLPMFLFISGSVNNDNLAIPLASLAVLLLILAVKRQGMGRQVAFQWWLLVGAVIGLAALTKEGTLGLIPLAVGTIGVVSWQKISSRQERKDAKKETLASFASLREDSSTLRKIPAILGRTVVDTAVLFVPILLIAGWWYYRNVQLYGDWLGWNAFIAVLGQRAHPASLRQLWGERWGFLMAFWGLFGGVNVPMAFWLYRVLNGLVVVGVVGFVVYLAELLRIEIARWREATGDWLRRLMLVVERRFGLLVCVLFSAAVVYGLIQWATTAWSSQGRLVFTALSALSVLLVIGLVGWMPRVVARRIVSVLGISLLIISAVAPFVWIRPAYEPVVAAESVPETLGIDFGDEMRLVGYELEQRRLEPGDSVWLALEWEALRPTTRDWSVFVHLNDPVIERPIAQRDMYPGQGLWATTLLEPGQRVVSRYLLSVPETAVAPAELELAVGLYDYQTGERLLTNQNEDAVWLAMITLGASEGDYPNPVRVRFEHGLELIGFNVEPRRINAGGEVVVTTYWRVNEPLTEDYTFFGQVVGGDTTRWAAQDLMLERPTSSWAADTVEQVDLVLSLNEDTPPELYPLIIGMYTRTADGGFDRLQLVTEDGRLTDDFLVLTQIRVD